MIEFEDVDAEFDHANAVAAYNRIFFPNSVRSGRRVSRKFGGITEMTLENRRRYFMNKLMGGYYGPPSSIPVTQLFLGMSEKRSYHKFEFELV
jgi:hypothetical protein